MNTTQYPLDQSSLLLLSGILASGHEESVESLPPMEQDRPRFPYSAIRDRIRDHAPRAPRNHTPYMENEEMPDISEDEDDESTENNLRAYAREKQGHEASPDFLPSMRSRGAIHSELASMGCQWGE